MKKLLILCMTFLCILTGCGNTDSAKNTEQNSSYQQVSMEEGLELMKEDSGYILLDVRRDDEFEEGHIPGAINIPYMLCLLSRKKSRKDHSAIYQLLYSWIMNMFIP